ncbi:MAG: hypothetical protein DWQ02_10310 [Bacteroidetes bacterium]|nr:MAG: hypothetical protein DWQ02_10310 [Bacteroidota bacterium]
MLTGKHSIFQTSLFMKSRMALLPAFCFFMACSYSTVYAQFFLNGAALQMSDSTCYQLTPEENNSVGSIWNPEKINLNESFEVVLEVFLGCKGSDGADGIVFGFQPVNTSIGTNGGSLGFGGVQPSIGIEIDTWENTNNGDPVVDHIAIIKNGNLNHNSSTNLEGPVQASASAIDIEDCNYHDLRVSWNADQQLLEVYFDCDWRLSYTGDIVDDIFGGDPWVYWGFTAATGAFNNFHRVCLKYTTFLDELEDVTMCPGGQVPFEISDGVSYSWSPQEGLDDPFSATPIASPEETTLYTVEIRDNCNYLFQDDVLVEVAGDSVFFDLGPDTMLCESNLLNLDVTTPTATYMWNDGSQEPVYNVSQSGTYMVTVTRTDTFCISTDRVTVDYTELPEVELGGDAVLCFNQKITLNAGHPLAETYLWQDGSSGNFLEVSTPGYYWVELSNTCGTIKDEIDIVFEDCREFYVPNAFSPNFDGINDYFLIYDDGDIVNISHLTIFDRWGGLVYENKNLVPNVESSGWNGRDAAAGVYTWFAKIEFKDGKTVMESGDVLLIR